MEDSVKHLLLQTIFVTGLALGVTSDAQAMRAAKKTVFTVDHDDVINTKEKMGVTDYAKYMVVIGKIGWNNPRGALGLVWNWRAIKNRGEQVAQRVQGTSNIIYTLAQELKGEGYADLTPYVEEMTAITVKPKPIWKTINHLKELKQQGYTIIGATNQDYYQHKAFREKMEAQGVKLSEIFDATVVAHTILKAKELQKTNALAQELEPGIFMPTSTQGHKIHTDYFKALKTVAQKYAPRANNFVHTDDKLENVKTARRVPGFANSVHFKLPEKSARHCSQAQLDATIAQWKSDVSKFN